MKTQDFIQTLYIDEVADVKDKHPYMAYMVMAAGIEFLGKVKEQPQRQNWFLSGHSKEDFVNAIEQLPGLNAYSAIADELYVSLRCGMLHSSCPKNGLTLRDGNASETISIEKTELSIDVFYDNFKEACNNVIQDINSGNLQITDDFLEITKTPVTQNDETASSGNLATDLGTTDYVNASGCPAPHL